MFSIFYNNTLTNNDRNYSAGLNTMSCHLKKNVFKHNYTRTNTKQQYGFMPGKSTTDRSIVCFESFDGEVQRRSE